MFICTIFDSSLYVVTENEVDSLPYSTKSDFIHLGDYWKLAGGFYVDCHLSRGDLYKKFSGLDYDLINFSILQDFYNLNGVLYYGGGSVEFGRIIYDHDIWVGIAQAVRDQIVSGLAKEISLF